MTTQTTTIDHQKIDPDHAAAAMNGNKKGEPATCPLTEDKIQLLPIRYALVEKLDPKLPLLSHKDDNQQTVSMNSHPVGYRLIRDGWLYIIDNKTNLLYEYQTFQGQVVGLVFKGAKVSHDERQGNAGSPYIIFTKDRTLSIKFSEIQWTAKKCNEILAYKKARQAIMQTIDLRGVNCGYQSKHLLLRKDCEKWLAEIAELYSSEQKSREIYIDKKFSSKEQQAYQHLIKPLFATEIDPYSWQDTDIATFQHTSIGQLLQSVSPKHQGGNYLFLAVEDYLAMMLDLAQERDIVTQWHEDWATRTRETPPTKEYTKNRVPGDITLPQNIAIKSNDLCYTIASYIESTLTMAEETTSTGNKWFDGLVSYKQQAIIDYINASIAYDNFDPTHYKGDPVQQKKRLADNFTQAQQNMYQQVGEKTCRFKHKSDIDQLEQQQQQQITGNLWGNRGLASLTHLPQLKSYLLAERERLFAWQMRLDKITEDRVYLFTHYFHNNAWYYDNSNPKQLQQALLIEQCCIRNLLSVETYKDQLTNFLEQHYVYLLPAFQTNINELYWHKAAEKIKAWLTKTPLYIKKLTENKPSEFQEFETKTISKEYLKKALNLPQDAQALHNAIMANYGPAVNQTLKELLTEIEQPAFSQLAQGRIINKLTLLENVINKLKLSGKMAFLLATKQQGFVLIDNNPEATQKVEIHINDALNKGNNIQLLRKQLKKLRVQRNKIYKKNAWPYSQMSQMEKNNQATHLNQQIVLCQQQITSQQSALAAQQVALKTLISPLATGEAPFKFRFYNTATQRQALALEKQMLALKPWQIAQQPAMQGTLQQIYQKSGLPTALFVWELLNLKSAIADYRLKQSQGVDIGLSMIIAGFTGSLSSGLSILQTIHTTIYKGALSQVEKIAKDTGLNLAGKMGQWTLIYSGFSQFFGFIAGSITLSNRMEQWKESIYYGKSTGERWSAAATLFATAGNTALGGANLGYTARTAFAVLYDVKLAKVPVSLGISWAMRGPLYATSIARLTPWGLLFTALQIGGEITYNYYNISDSQQWFLHSCWGTEAQQQWDKKQHFQELAQALFKPWLEDLGVNKTPQGEYIRTIRLCIPGQTFNTLADNPLGWLAHWQTYSDIDADLIQTTQTIDQTDLGPYLQATAKVIKTVAPLTLEWDLPWYELAEWDPTQKEKITLQLWHKPDELAYEDLNAQQNGLFYEIDITNWDIDRKTYISTPQQPGKQIIQAKPYSPKVANNASPTYYRGTVIDVE